MIRKRSFHMKVLLSKQTSSSVVASIGLRGFLFSLFGYIQLHRDKNHDRSINCLEMILAEFEKTMIQIL